MKHAGQIIQGGKVLFALKDGKWEEFTICNWQSKPEPVIYGRFKGGDLQRIPAVTRWRSPSHYVRKVPLDPLVAEIHRQNWRRFA